MNEAIRRLEGLSRQIQAARETQGKYPGQFSEGLSAGLRIALEAVDHELQAARHLEELLEVHQ